MFLYSEFLDRTLATHLRAHLQLSKAYSSCLLEVHKYNVDIWKCWSLGVHCYPNVILNKMPNHFGSNRIYRSHPKSVKLVELEVRNKVSSFESNNFYNLVSPSICWCHSFQDEFIYVSCETSQLNSAINYLRPSENLCNRCTIYSYSFIYGDYLYYYHSIWVHFLDTSSVSI